MKEDKDPMGTAIREYFKTGRASRLKVLSPDFDDDYIPVPTLFRNFKEMPPLERIALERATGRILDVGAGSGCHSLALQEMGKTVEACEISPLAVETMRERGVKIVRQEDFFQLAGEPYDTILMLMNGSGIVGTTERMPEFFTLLRRILAPGGSVYMDSTDLRYLYEDEDGSFMIDLNDDYYGQVEFQMQYRNIKGEPFTWLYIDFNTLQMYAEDNGFHVEMIHEGDHYDYLARIYR